MKSKRSRLALMGMLTLALALTVGLVSGSVADAKKGKKKGAKSVTISKTTPTTLPPSTPPPPTPPGTTINRSVTSVPLTVGKKFKGKVVSQDSVSVSFTLTGSARTGAGTVNDVPAAASNILIDIIAPNGRDLGVINPGFGDDNATTIGPVTVTPDSPFSVCDTIFTGPMDDSTVCVVNDSNATVKPPSYTGTLGESDLADLGGVPVKGTWTFQFRNLSRVTTATASSISATIGVNSAPAA
jgi:hypothetical protein